MSKIVIGVGSAANDGTGDPLRTAFIATNSNFTEVYDGTPEYPLLRTDEIKSDTTAATDLTVTTGADKTLVLGTPVWDDLRIVPTSFDFGGSSDPSLVTWTLGAGGSTMLYEFAKTDIAYFTAQLPHTYKIGTDLSVHIHWTPGSRGTAEAGATVGWKVAWTWASINGTFGAMQTADLSDTVFNGGADPAAAVDQHQMTPSVTMTGTGKGISSQIVGYVTRTDTGTDDTWASSTNGQLPLLLELDFHFQSDTIGSRQESAK